MSRWGVGVLVLCAVLAAPGRAVEPAKPPRVAPATASQPASAPSAKPEPLEHRAFRALEESPYDALVLRAAAEWDFSPFVLLALLWVESRLEAKVVHKRTGAAGLGQFVPSGRRAVSRLRAARGAPRTFTLAQALDPAEAVPAAAELLSHLVERCGDLERGLGAYNRGRCGGVRGFVSQVLRRANYYRTAAGLPPWPDLTPPRRRPVAAGMADALRTMTNEPKPAEPVTPPVPHEGAGRRRGQVPGRWRAEGTGPLPARQVREAVVDHG